MNTTQYGEDFEVQVFNFLKNLLSNDDVPGTSAKRSKIFHKKKIWLDYHANQFASAILIPTTRLVPLVREVFQHMSITTPKFVVDNQPFKSKILQSILSFLALHFKVSKEAMFIRLKEDGFVSDIRKQPQRICNILRGH